jgi:hypothetical protein
VYTIVDVEEACNASRDIDVIDRELSLLAVARASLRGGGALPSMRAVDELLDERLGLATQTPRVAK